MGILLKRGLEEDGCAVDVACDGTDGLFMATDNPYAAVVLDVMLPGLDGFEIARRLRAVGRWAPILLLTARHEVGDRVEGLRQLEKLAAHVAADQDGRDHPAASGRRERGRRRQQKRQR